MNENQTPIQGNMPGVVEPQEVQPQVENIAPEVAEAHPRVENETPVSVNPLPPKKKSLVLPLLLILLLVTSASAYYMVKTNSSTSNDEAAMVIPTPKPFFLTVDNLKQSVTVVDGELLVTGKTIAGATVAVLSDSDESIVEANDEGIFASSVVVGEVGGLVNVVAYGDKGEEENITFNVIETPAVLGKTDEKTNNGKADEVKNKTKPVMSVQEVDIETERGKSDVVKKDSKVQIKEFLVEKVETKTEKKMGKDKLLEILAREGTESAKIRNTYTLTKMETKIASKGAELKRHAVSGIISDISDDRVTVVHQIQRDRTYTVYFNANTLIKVKGIENATTDDLVVGMRITAAGIPTDEGILASRIYVIPGKAVGIMDQRPLATASAIPIATESAKPVASASAQPTASAAAETIE